MLLNRSHITGKAGAAPARRSSRPVAAHATPPESQAASKIASDAGEKISEFQRVSKICGDHPGQRTTRVSSLPGNALARVTNSDS
jgi:hypothetical protein